MTQQTITLDFIPSGICPVVYGTQGDHGLRQIIINPIHADLSGMSAVISGTKKDGYGFQYNGTISGGKIYFDVTKQMTIYAEDVLCTVTLANGSGDTIASSFVLSIKKNGLDEGTEVSDSDLLLLAEMPSYAVRAEQAAERAEQAAVVSADGTTITQASSGALSVSNSVLSTTLKGMSIDGITSYPTSVGVYRVTANKPSGLPPYASSYGTLIIYGAEYWGHIYIGSNNDAWITRTSSLSTAPSETSWKQISNNTMASRSETDLNDITELGVWRLVNTPTDNAPNVLGATGAQFASASLEVTGLGTDMLIQKLTVTNNSGYPTHAGRAYQRVKISSSSAWSEWSEILLNRSFEAMGVASIKVDYNTLTQSGYYPRILSSTSTNGPSFIAYLMVFSSPIANGNLSYVTQIAIALFEAKIAMRWYSSASKTWSTWKTFTAT